MYLFDIVTERSKNKMLTGNLTEMMERSKKMTLKGIYKNKTFTDWFLG